MAGQLINRGRDAWLVRVYLGTDRDTGKRGVLPVLSNGKSTPQSTPPFSISLLSALF